MNSENGNETLPEETPPARRFLKLAPHFYLLWGVLWFLVGTKVFLLRGTSGGDIAFVAIFGALLLGIPYGVAWAVWRISGREMQKAEFAFLAVSAVVFLIPTIALYREGLAAGG